MKANLRRVAALGAMVVVGFLAIVLSQGVPLSELFGGKPVAPPEPSAADVPRLIAALDSPDALARLSALKDLARIGPAANPAVPRLAKKLREGNPSVRHLVIEAIGAAKPTAAQTREIVPLAWDADRQNGDGGRLVQAMEPGAAAEYLAGRLADRDPAARVHAVELLGWLDAPSATARAKLAALIADPDAGVAAKAAYGLNRCVDEACLTALIGGLKSPAAAVRRACSVTLRYDGPAAARAAGALKAALADPDPDVAMLAAIAYAAVGGDRSVAAAALVAVLRARRTVFVWQAADAVGRLGIDGAEVRQVLREATAVPDGEAPGLARAAREALEALARGKS